MKMNLYLKTPSVTIQLSNVGLLDTVEIDLKTPSVTIQSIEDLSMTEDNVFKNT